MSISLAVACFLLYLLCYLKKGEMSCPDSDEDTVASWSLDGSEKDIILRGMASYKYEDGVPALYLDGNTSYADVPSISLFQFPAFSITCWVKVLEPAKNPGYIYADWSSPHQFSIWVHGPWKVVYFQLRSNFGENMIAMYTAVSFNVWEHVTLTWDEGLKLAKIFINGTLAGRKNAVDGLKSYELKNNSHSFYQIGRKEDSEETFHGLVRKLKVFNKVLTSNEILAEMSEFSSGCAMDSIGVSNPDIIPDSHMTASSTHAASRYQSEYGRLGDIRGDGWCSLTSNSNEEWLQVYFEDMFTVCRVDTQGDVNGNEWVTAFKLSFSKDGVSWTTYKHNNGTEVEFRRQGNSIIVDKHYLSVPVQARYIRFNPTDRHNFNCLRVEVYGSKMYHFDTWLIIANERLTLDLLNSTSQQYNTMKTNVMQEFNGILTGSYGFLLAEFLRFGAQSPSIESNKILLMADIKVFCTNSAVKLQLLNKIKSSIKSMPLFDSSYGEAVDTVNCTCSPANVNLNLSKTLDQVKVFYTTELIVFNAEVNHSICSSSSQLKSYWQISREKSKGFTSFLAVPLQRSKPYWSMRRAKIVDSYYYVSYVLRILPQLDVIGYDYGYVLVLQGSPVANISGVSFAIEGDGNITLNGSLSYDPREVSLNFIWFCRRNYEAFPENDPQPVVDFPNKNLSSSGGCYGYGPGRLSGVGPILVVNVDKMEAGQQYVFELAVSNGMKSSKAVHWLTVKRKAFFISCIYNCGPNVIISKRMIIESNCTEEIICKSITRHNWSLFKMDYSDSWMEITDVANRILTDLNNPNLVLTGRLDGNRYSLEMNTTYKIKGSISVEGGSVLEDEITFQTVSPLSSPKQGCKVKPVEGLVLKTNFTVNCSGWLAEHVNLTYGFSYITSTGLVIVKSGTHVHHLSTKLPQGNASEDYNVTIKVEIYDQGGASHEEMLTVKVRPLKINDSSIVEKVTREIEAFLMEGQVQEAATLAIALLSSNDNDTAKDSVLRAMAGAQVSHISEATQLSVIAVITTDDRDTIPLDNLEDAGILLNTIVTFLHTHAQDNRDVVQEVSTNVLQGLSNTLNASADITDNYYNQLSDQEAATGLPKRLRRGAKQANTVDRGYRRAKNLTEKTLSLVDMLGTTLLSIKMTGERKSNYKSKAIGMTLKRQSPAKLGGESLSGGEDEGDVTFPSTQALFGSNGTNFSSVDTQMVSLKMNPYVWSNTSTDVKSSVLSVDLKKLDGSRLTISGLNRPIELFIPKKDPEEANQNDTKGHLFVKPYNDYNAFRYHKIVLTNDLEFGIVEIRPQNDTIFDVFVSAGFKPTPQNYTYKARIPDVSLCGDFKHGIGYFNCTSNPYTFSLSSNITGDIGVQYIGIRLALEANETNTQIKHRRVARSCMDRHGRQKRSCIGVKDPPTTPPPTPKIIVPKYDAHTDVNYTMSLKMRSCLYWSEKKQAWTSEGCKVGGKDVNGKLHCSCTHLSAFGGSIFVAPNPIDFNKVFTEFTRFRETRNFVVLSTVCVIFGIYFVGLIFARRADKKDSKKVVANVHLTNSEMEGYTYNISIQTGVWGGFGTSARVGIIIDGNKGSSGEILLTDPLARRKYFTRGSVNNFTLTLPSSLGKLTDIRIWHDNSGPNPAWFLQDVVITDQQTEKIWYFFANQWLSLDKRSGTIVLDIEAAEEDEITSFKPLFYARTARSLGEGHIWISVFTRPPQNPFTRCQRLTCCLSFLFAAMVTNAMFYEFDRTPTDTFKFGPLVISWTQIKIGIQSSVIAIPANLLVVLIFRNIKQASSTEIFNPQEMRKASKTPGFLPSFFVYIGWCLSLLIALTGAAFTVMYSMMWGADVSNQWLTSILVSLVQDVLITQPIKVLALATLLSLVIKKPPEHDPVIGPLLFMSKESERVVLKPTQEGELEKEKDASSKEWNMLEAIKEVLSFLIFSILLMVVCYGNLHPARYQVTVSISNIFGGFDKVIDASSLWKWVDDVLVPGLYDVTWYNGQPFGYKEGFISNKKSFLMGMPRMRQLRIKSKEHCQKDLLDTSLNDLFSGCLETYSSDSEDRTPFNLPEWIPLKNFSHFPSANDICPKPWRYQSASNIDTLSHEAVKETYDGGGFVADLGYNQASASEVLRDLRAHNWVDKRTAAVFIEFTLFDPSSSLFCNIRNVYERLPTGQVLTQTEFRALSLYPSVNSNFQSFYEVCQLLFLIVIVVCFIAEMAKFFRQKRYFFQIWNWVQLILLVVSLVAVVMSFLKMKHTSLYVKNIQTNPYQTFSSDSIVRLLDMEIFWLSMAIFIITLKFLRLIRFNPHVCQMQETLRRSAKPILSFSLVMCIAIVAFTHFGYLCFGKKLLTFSSFFKTLRLVFQMSVGKSINNVEVHSQYPVLGPLFLLFFLLVILFVLINVFVAVLVDAYAEIREEHGDGGFTDAELGTFMYDVFLKKIKEFPGKITSGIGGLSHNPFGKSSTKTGHVFKITPERKCSCPEILVGAFPQEVFDVSKTNAMDDPTNEVLREDYVLAYIKTRFIEIRDELKSSNSCSKSH